MIKLYNEIMGKVDLADFLLSQKYYHRLIFHILNMVMNNAWLLYRRDHEKEEVKEYEKGEVTTEKVTLLSLKDHLRMSLRLKEAAVYRDYSELQ